MLTKGMIMVIIGISGLIITLGIGAYTSRKYKKQLESVESAPSTLSLSEQLTKRKETKTMVKSKNHEQLNGSIPLQPLPEFNLGNEEDSVKIDTSNEHLKHNVSQEENSPMKADLGFGHFSNIDVEETTIMNKVDETLIIKQPENTMDEQQTTLLKQPDETILLERGNGDRTLILNQDIKK